MMYRMHPPGDTTSWIEDQDLGTDTASSNNAFADGSINWTGIIPTTTTFTGDGSPHTSQGNVADAGGAAVNSTASADSDGTTTETVSFSGSGIVFVNTFSASSSTAYENAVIAAEQVIASFWSNPITLNLDFGTDSPGQNGTLATNSWPSWTIVSYATLRGALLAHAPGDVLPTSDPNPAGGNDWYLPEAYARMLGLSSSTPTYDDTITLNTSYNWSYGQDVINTIEHEISEGAMGRVGGLGHQNGVWSTMDLFRYSAANTPYYTWDTTATYFSSNGVDLSSIRFDTSVTGGDVADFYANDVFGYGFTGETNTLSTTDKQLMSALGWTHTTSLPPPNSNMLFQNTSGPLVQWQMNGTTITGGGQIGGNPGPTWFAMGTGGFYAGDTSDIAWQNQNGLVAIWQVQGTSVVGGGLVPGNPGPTWHIKGTGDFYGDGHTDILWQNDNGSVAIWEMNGATISGGGVVAINPGPTWRIKGTGDFYGDGRTDILWQNDNGSVVIWEMNGATISGGGVVAFNPGPTWHIKGTGDFNRDGRTDIAWQNDNGSVVIWEMNGATISGGGIVANPGTAWNIIGGDKMRFIYSTSANETLAATPTTPDEFVFTSFAAGAHTIAGFNPVQDMIELSKAQFASFSDVQSATTAVAGGTIINLTNGSSLLLPGVASASLHASNFALA